MRDKKSISIRIKPETKDMIVEICERRGQSITVVVDRAITLAYREMQEGKDSIATEPRSKSAGRKKR